jgi:hypothetical protein
MTGTKAATIFSPSPLTSHSDLVPLLLALDEMEMKMKGDIKGWSAYRRLGRTQERHRKGPQK